jgi:hypothetical protein
MATPFVQGRLRGTPLTVTMASACSWCNRPLRLEVTDALDWRLLDAPESMLVFEPEIDWSTFTGPTIVHDY